MRLSDAVKDDESAKESLLAVQDRLLRSLGQERKTVSELVEEYGSLNDAIRTLSAQELSRERIDIGQGVFAAAQSAVRAMSDGFFTSNSLVSVGGRNYNQATMDHLASLGLIRSSSYGSGGGSLYLGDLSSIEGIISAYEFLDEIIQEINI
jgi:hypothetical protein